MSKQILFCVEANKRSRTDYQYIEAVIKRFYTDDKKILYRPVFMGSKTKYNAKDVTREINGRKKLYKDKGDTYVIYFIDTDDYDTSPDTRRLYEDISLYCRSNGHDMVFFCRDVEDVFHGQQVSDGDKIKMAGIFNRKHLIDNVEEIKLRSETHRRHCSNILSILDKYWTRK